MMASGRAREGGREWVRGWFALKGASPQSLPSSSLRGDNEESREWVQIHLDGRTRTDDVRGERQS